jgi:hypothetical protein
MTCCIRPALVWLALVHAGCQARAESSSIGSRFDAFSRRTTAAAHLADDARATAVGSAYDEQFSASSNVLDQLHDSDLDLVFRAAQAAAFYTRDARHIRDMQSAIDELETRGLASRRHYMRAQETFIKARRIGEALELSRRHPDDVEAVPVLREAAGIEPGQPTEWVVAPARPELLRRGVDLRATQVLVVSHPRCHFSRAAMHDIEADPTLRQVFDAHARWLAPHDGSFSLDAIQRWNGEHPSQTIALAFRREEWPMIDSWETPTFYFLDDGVVVAKVQGWPRGGRRDELLTALRRVGLMK